MMHALVKWYTADHQLESADNGQLDHTVARTSTTIADPSLNPKMKTSVRRVASGMKTGPMTRAKLTNFN